jgi:hypothetical protein
MTIDGELGDFVALFMSFTGGSLRMAGKQGVFSLGSPFNRALLPRQQPIPGRPLGRSLPQPQLLPASRAGSVFPAAARDPRRGAGAVRTAPRPSTIVDSTIP